MASTTIGSSTVTFGGNLLTTVPSLPMRNFSKFQRTLQIGRLNIKADKAITIFLMVAIKPLLSNQFWYSGGGQLGCHDFGKHWKRNTAG